MKTFEFCWRTGIVLFIGWVAFVSFDPLSLFVLLCAGLGYLDFLSRTGVIR